MRNSRAHERVAWIVACVVFAAGCGSRGSGGGDGSDGGRTGRDGGSDPPQQSSACVWGESSWNDCEWSG